MQGPVRIVFACCAEHCSVRCTISDRMQGLMCPKPCLAPGLLPHVPLSVNGVEPLVLTRRMHAVTQP